MILRKATSFVLQVAVFLRQSIKRFIADRCLTGASALSYATLVSLVPLTAVVLVIFSGFPMFSGARDHFLAVLLDNFVPAVGEEAAAWFKHVATTTAQTTAVGSIALVVTSILLLATIEEELHVIWRVTTPRLWVQRVLAYWMVLTLGPLLLGVGLSLSGYLDTIAYTLGMNAVRVEQTTRAWFANIPGLVSFVLETTAFTLLYCLIPNCVVRLRDGLAGALAAAALLEGLKLAFAVFIARISSYNTIYGALAGIPIVLLWMYIFWAVVLFGAEIAAGLGYRWDDEGEAPRFGARHVGIVLAEAPITDESAGVAEAATATGREGELTVSRPPEARSAATDHGQDGQDR